MKVYRHDIDILKGLSIIAVVLFHLGLVKSGYLGVDAFFVINGFFLIPSLYKNILCKDFSYRAFIKKRILRLLPLISVASLVCLAIGYIGMLPDDYENLSQSVVASNLLSQNILSYITVSDYWNAINDFKPLMHLWYVGILAEFYVLFPLLLMGIVAITDKIGIDRGKSLRIVLILSAIASLVIYVGPWFSDGVKFYMLPSRLFEMILGGLTAILLYNSNTNCSNLFRFSLITVLTIIIYSSLLLFNVSSMGNSPIIVGSDRPVDDGLIFPKTLLLLFTVLMSVAFVNSNSNVFKSTLLEWFGKRSYSIFIWHQLILAFIRYYLTTEITWWGLLLYFAVTLSVSELSYRFIEKKVVVNNKSLRIWCFSALVCILFGMGIYMNAGVVRDVPELEIKKGEGKRGMFSEYCDRVYAYNKDFSGKVNKINVLVEGVSYGRDFCNVLLESEFKDSIDLSYIEKWETANYTERIKKADVIFTFRSKKKVPQYVWDAIVKQRIVGLGTKAYGINNGQVYSHRNTPDYYSMTVNAFPECIRLNEEWKSEWGEQDYVDFMEAVLRDGNRVKVFTPDNKFISQDCRHLTPAGAKYYANNLNLKRFFSKHTLP